MQLIDLLLLGGVAGFTIFLGLPVARMRSVSAKTRGMLNSAAAGILLFLLVDVMSSAFSTTADAVLGGLRGTVQPGSALLYSFLLVGGVAAGLLGLVWFESRYLKEVTKGRVAAASEKTARRVAGMIAVGIGLHNFSEGLAIGQSYAGGAISLALLLVVGFGLHNATEGFGIAAPLSGFRPGWRYLAVLGLIGGGPTFLGALLGGFWVSPALYLFFLALAAGAIIYVVKELLFHGKIRGEGPATMGSLIAGFFLGFATDLVLKFATGG